MGIEKVREYFKKRDLEDKIIEFDSSSATVELAAQLIACKEEEIAKTLSFKLDNKAILIVAAGDAKVDNKKYKMQFSAKAKMLSPEENIDLIGFPIGGVCPFATRGDVDIYLDESLKRFKTVYPACGSSNSVIELTIEELEKHSNYSSWVDVCKDWKK
ncbi:MAG TPA: YbaK/EbsC family protein [Tissierellaceae bacterium]|nr:YbaK/EbsC family protein [Tissierellaceae bacterium]